MEMDCILKTRLRDLSGEEERGARTWRSAELVGESWYLVEHCIEVDGLPKIRQWIAASPHECGRLASADHALWSRVLAYVRLPLSAGAGFIFGELMDIHEVRSSGRRLLRFTNGTTVMIGSREEVDEIASFATEELRLVFSKSPMCRVAHEVGR